MNCPRLRRLNPDFERLKARFARRPLIQMTGTSGLSPEQYLVIPCDGSLQRGAARGSQP